MLYYYYTLKVEVKYLRGAFWRNQLSAQIFHAPEAKLRHYAAELRTLSVTYPLCGSSALTSTMDSPSEVCPLKLKEFCLFLYH